MSASLIGAVHRAFTPGNVQERCCVLTGATMLAWPRLDAECVTVAGFGHAHITAAVSKTAMNLSSSCMS